MGQKGLVYKTFILDLAEILVFRVNKKLTGMLRECWRYNKGGYTPPLNKSMKIISSQCPGRRTDLSYDREDSRYLVCRQLTDGRERLEE